MRNAVGLRRRVSFGPHQDVRVRRVKLAAGAMASRPHRGTQDASTDTGGRRRFQAGALTAIAPPRGAGHDQISPAFPAHIAHVRAQPEQLSACASRAVGTIRRAAARATADQDGDGKEGVPRIEIRHWLEPPRQRRAVRCSCGRISPRPSGGSTLHRQREDELVSRIRFRGIKTSVRDR